MPVCLLPNSGRGRLEEEAQGGQEVCLVLVLYVFLLICTTCNLPFLVLFHSVHFPATPMPYLQAYSTVSALLFCYLRVLCSLPVPCLWYSPCRMPVCLHRCPYLLDGALVPGWVFCGLCRHCWTNSGKFCGVVLYSLEGGCMEACMSHMPAVPS
jgi:hypothetical protein